MGYDKLTTRSDEQAMAIGYGAKSKPKSASANIRRYGQPTRNCSRCTGGWAKTSAVGKPNWLGASR
jgi:hypothetical protein